MERGLAGLRVEAEETAAGEVEAEFLAVDRGDDGARITGEFGTGRAYFTAPVFLSNATSAESFGFTSRKSTGRGPLTLPPTGTMIRSPSMSGTLPAPKKFWWKKYFAFVSTYHTSFPLATLTQHSTPSGP